MVTYSKAHVRQVLHQSNLPDRLRAHFQAIVDDTLPQYYLRTLTTYREQYSDEIPVPDVPVTDPDYRFLRLQLREKNSKLKCRATVILGISLSLQGVIGDEVLTAEKDRAVVDAYRTRDWNAFKGGKGEFWTTPEEVQFINCTLDTVIASIKEKYCL